MQIKSNNLTFQITGYREDGILVWASDSSKQVPINLIVHLVKKTPKTGRFKIEGTLRWVEEVPFIEDV